MAAPKTPANRDRDQARRRAAQKAAQDFRAWADMLDGRDTPNEIRDWLVESHQAAVRRYLGADGADAVAYYAWAIVEALNDALAFKKLGSRPEVIGKEIWRGMQSSATDLRNIPLEPWIEAVAAWKGRKNDAEAQRFRRVSRGWFVKEPPRAGGRPRAGTYDYRAIIHPLLDIVTGKTTKRESRFKQLDGMPWDARAPYHATTFKAFRSGNVKPG